MTDSVTTNAGDASEILVAKNRLVVIETVIHQQFDQPATCVDNRFSRNLEDVEQPYIRTGSKALVGVNWRPIDCGWIEQASYLVIINEEGKFTQTVPSEEEKEIALNKVIELGIDGALNTPFLIRPLQSMRVEPSSLRSLQIRCPNGPARYTIAIYPR